MSSSSSAQGSGSYAEDVERLYRPEVQEAWSGNSVLDRTGLLHRELAAVVDAGTGSSQSMVQCGGGEELVSLLP